VKEVTCPECSEDRGESTERTVVEEGVKIAFECGSCSHVWDVVF
jgi:uncharacterized Zn finger protein